MDAAIFNIYVSKISSTLAFQQTDKYFSLQKKAYLYKKIFAVARFNLI